ncbi:hypothetical protein SAMN05444266_108121 [Chitinophaga jiangningensis]|uniref:Uncharacterized protein n=1 Tax=Chitinophaga jiangningensis TaxID=1419482 RepID=A0A1M7IWE2_9BACT|nr:hypothetical protein [Chitinophaga jiangningensis]SHM45009.1 hypothetical protein SAMN05444266_108121 [Chitinophaga jiangningensis]
MKESKLYQTIKKDFKAAGFTFNEYNFDLKPAWRFAFYNSEETIRNEEEIFRTYNPTMYLLIGFPAVFTVFSLLMGEFKVAYAVAVATAIAALIAQLIIKHYDLDTPKILVINKEGVRTAEKQYRWEDYELAYIALIPLHRRNITLIPLHRWKQQHAQLILIQNDEPAAYIDVSYWDIARVAALIKHFQPPGYKQGLL